MDAPRNLIPDSKSGAIRVLLIVLFVGVLGAMFVVTIRASFVRSVFENGPLLRDPWFLATLCDAYFGFLTFFVWVAYKETSNSRRVLWFVLIMTLGNFAMAAYALWQLLRLKSGRPVWSVLLREQHVQFE